MLLLHESQCPVGVALLVCACLALGTWAVAQEELLGELTVETHAPATAAQGEPFQVQLVARYHGAGNVRLLVDNTEDWRNLELVRRSVTDRAKTTATGERVVERVFTLEVVAPAGGRARLPGLEVAYTLSGEPMRQYAPSAAFEVEAVRLPLLTRLKLPVIGLVVVVLALLIGVVLWRGMHARRQAQRDRQPLPGERLQEKMDRLRRVRLEGDSRPYYQQAETVLAQWCAETHGTPGRYNSPDELGDALRESGVPDGDVERIVKLAQRCYEGKYTPARAQSDELERFERELQNEIDRRREA